MKKLDLSENQLRVIVYLPMLVNCIISYSAFNALLHEIINLIHTYTVFRPRAGLWNILASGILALVYGFVSLGLQAVRWIFIGFVLVHFWHISPWIAISTSLPLILFDIWFVFIIYRQ